MEIEHYQVQHKTNSDISGISFTPEILIRPNYKIEAEQIINQLPDAFAAK